MCSVVTGAYTTHMTKTATDGLNTITHGLERNSSLLVNGYTLIDQNRKAVRLLLLTVTP